jgi:hypothetical protein
LEGKAEVHRKFLYERLTLCVLPKIALSMKNKGTASPAARRTAPEGGF